MPSEPHPWNFAANCSTWPRSFVPLKRPTPALPACVLTVISPLPSSKDLTQLSFDGDSFRHGSPTPHNPKPSAASWCAQCTPTSTCLCTRFLLSLQLVALPNHLQDDSTSLSTSSSAAVLTVFISCISPEHQPAFRYFLHGPPRPPLTSPASFKSRYRKSAANWHSAFHFKMAPPRISDQR